MANTFSRIFGLIMPQDQADNNLWGQHVLTDLDDSTGGGANPSVDLLLGRPRWQRFTLTTGQIDLSQAMIFELTIAAATTFSIVNTPADPANGSGTNPHIGSVFLLKLINGGSQTLTWPASVTWLTYDGSVPTFKAAGTDEILFMTNNNGTNWFAAMLSQQKKAIAAHAKATGILTTDGTEAAVALIAANIDFDTGSPNFWSVANATRFTPPLSGKYRITANSAWVAAGSSSFNSGVRMRIRKNGVTVLQESGLVVPAGLQPANVNPAVICEVLASLATTDYVEFMLFGQNAGNPSVNFDSSIEWMGS